MVKATIEWKDGTKENATFKGADEYFRFIHRNIHKIKIATSDADQNLEQAKKVY